MSNSVFYFNDATVDNLDLVQGRNYYDNGSGLQFSGTISGVNCSHLLDWSLGTIYKVYHEGNTTQPGEQYPEFEFKFQENYAANKIAIGNHNIATESDGWELYYRNGLTDPWVLVLDSGLSVMDGTDSDQVVSVNQFAQIKPYWKIRLLNPTPNFKIGLFCFCKDVEIPYLSASLTYITSQIDTASTNAAYGQNYHLSQFNESDDDLTINLNNLTREYKDNNAKTIIEGTKSPFIFYYDKITNLAAYCYPVGTQRGVKLNNNHLYSITTKTKARSWS
tara:strand:+ start:4114 stop:4944 length:831 start_codon:yes stop_codon:yes gene_type:complete